jgi:hypothetical protein
MPKIGPELKKIRAEELSNIVIKHKGNLASAARELGVSRQNVRQNINTPEVKKTLAEKCDKYKLTDSRILKKLDVLMDATTMVSGGKGMPPIEVEDNTAQLNTVKVVLQIKGHLKPGLGDGGIAGDLHLHSTKVFQGIPEKGFEDLSYADSIREFTDRLSKQRR